MASTVRGRGGVLVESESGLGRAKERLLGFWEIWDENEREEREEVSEDNNVIVDIFLQFFFFFFSLRFESRRIGAMSREGQPLLLYCVLGDFGRPGIMIITSDNVISVSPRPTKRRRLGHSLVAVLSFVFGTTQPLLYCYVQSGRLNKGINELLSTAFNLVHLVDFILLSVDFRLIQY